MSARTGPQTALRERYELIRGHPVEWQLRECIDYLENPEVFVAEFVDSCQAMERFAKSGRRMPRGSSSGFVGAAKAIESLAGEERILVPDSGTTYAVVIAPQDEAQDEAIGLLLKDVNPREYAGGRGYPVGRFHSTRYAEFICSQYRAMGFFTVVITSDSRPPRHDAAAALLNIAS